MEYLGFIAKMWLWSSGNMTGIQKACMTRSVRNEKRLGKFSLLFYANKNQISYNDHNDDLSTFTLY